MLSKTQLTEALLLYLSDDRQRNSTARFNDLTLLAANLLSHSSSATKASVHTLALISQIVMEMLILLHDDLLTVDNTVDFVYQELSHAKPGHYPQEKAVNRLIADFSSNQQLSIVAVNDVMLSFGINWTTMIRYVCARKALSYFTLEVKRTDGEYSNVWFGLGEQQLICNLIDQPIDTECNLFDLMYHGFVSNYIAKQILH